MQQAKTGDVVTIDYEGRLQSGEVFETTAEAGPLEFEVGAKAVLPAFEEIVVGMTVGETRTLELSPDQGYGPRREELVQSFDATLFGTGMDPQPGMVLGMSLEREGKTEKVPGLVTEVRDGQVIIDFNHPLAGQTLVFRITLSEIAAPAVGNGCRPAADGGCSSSG